MIMHAFHFQANIFNNQTEAVVPKVQVEEEVCLKSESLSYPAVFADAVLWDSLLYLLMRCSGMCVIARKYEESRHLCHGA